MRRNRRMRSFNEENETKKIVYISIGIAIIAILTFIITYVIYSNALSNQSTVEFDKITELSSMQNEQAHETSQTIGKSVNEVKEENMEIKNEEQDVNKIAINTSKEENQTNTVKSEISTNSTPTSEEQEKKEEKIPDPTFIKPVDGDIIREYAVENLVYSETLKEWITHTGIDIKADKTTIVKASSDGVVKSIKNDPRYGITVTIAHANGFTSIYSNLLTSEFVKEGEEIKQGQTIGTVGNTASFEILDDCHLHFELLKDNQYLNPCDYIN